jgi:hypothetical protein
MKISNLPVLLAVIVVLLGASYMYERVHRYDVVVAGTGEGSIGGYLIDHTTGEVWYLQKLAKFDVQSVGK